VLPQRLQPGPAAAHLPRLRGDPGRRTHRLRRACRHRHARGRPGAAHRSHSRLPARHGRCGRTAPPTATPLPGKDHIVTAPLYDILSKNVRAVRRHGNIVHEGDSAMKDGKYAKVAPGIDPSLAKQVHDGHGLLAFPGVVDAHMHSGIYSPLAEDAVTESKAAA